MSFAYAGGFCHLALVGRIFLFCCLFLGSEGSLFPLMDRLPKRTFLAGAQYLLFVAFPVALVVLPISVGSCVFQLLLLACVSVSPGIGNNTTYQEAHKSTHQQQPCPRHVVRGAVGGTPCFPRDVPRQFQSLPVPAFAAECHDRIPFRLSWPPTGPLTTRLCAVFCRITVLKPGTKC